MFAIKTLSGEVLRATNGSLLTFLNPDNAGWWIHHILPRPCNYSIIYLG